MTSLHRIVSIVLLACFAPMFGGCAAHYQDLLRDRDAEIRELEGRLANANARASDLERREHSALAKLSDFESRPVDATADRGLADRVQRELGTDTDVRFEKGRLSIGIDNTVTFTSGSTKLKNSASSVLKRVVKLLQRDYPSRRIYVEGHTDTDPIKKTAGRYRNNRHLSLERADAVARFLTDSCGMRPASVAVVGYGEFQPRVPGSGKAAKARNRRVEIVVGESL